MTRTTTRRARKRFRCGCGATIRPGDRYLEHVASPHHDDLCNPHWWRVQECASCAERYGRVVA